VEKLFLLYYKKRENMNTNYHKNLQTAARILAQNKKDMQPSEFCNQNLLPGKPMNSRAEKALSRGFFGII
jgi:hypothetical protein